MNDEIKEILEYFKVGIDKLCISKPDFSISYNDVKILLDYITNLQQAVKNTKETADDMLYELNEENERLKTKTKEQSLLLIDYQDMEQKLEDYKSRIEKAVAYIKEQYKWIEESDERWQPVLDNKKILNILNGRSDE